MAILGIAGRQRRRGRGPSGTADLLIVNARLVTMDETFRVIEGGAIAIEGSRIVAVGGARDRRAVQSSWRPSTPAATS